jgi:hypothetical protein
MAAGARKDVQAYLDRAGGNARLRAFASGGSTTAPPRLRAAPPAVMHSALPDPCLVTERIGADCRGNAVDVYDPTGRPSKRLISGPSDGKCRMIGGCGCPVVGFCHPSGTVRCRHRQTTYDSIGVWCGERYWSQHARERAGARGAAGVGEHSMKIASLCAAGIFRDLKSPHEPAAGK